MKITDYYDGRNNDHKLFLAQEVAKLGHFDKKELRELSGAMTVHGMRLCELLRACRSYIDNPFGKYFYLEKDLENGTRKAAGSNR